MLLSVLGFLVILGPLVIVHELGHFLFARFFRVKAEVFSIGFGPTLWKRKIGETELRLSAVPLGGYVKLMGEDSDAQIPPEEQARALQRQAPWKRFLIFFGGPLFNFLFAILVFMSILVIGEPQLASVVGRAVKGSAAEKAGFAGGDRIRAIDGEQVRKFEEVATAITAKPGARIRFDVERDGAPMVIEAETASEEGYSEYGEATRVGEIEGLMAASRGLAAGVSNPDSQAGKAGIATGDLVVEMNGVPLESWETLEARYLREAPGATLRFKVRTGTAEPREVALAKPLEAGAALGSGLGLYSSELFVDKTQEKTPAEAAGIQRGDRLVAIGGKEVQSFFELKKLIQDSGEKQGKVEVAWERAGKAMSATIVPNARDERDPVLKKTTQYTIGVNPMLSWAEPETVIERIWNPFTLVYRGSERMISYTWRNFVSLKKMVTGDVSVATLGGPILIGRIAGESLARGLIAFLSTMGVLSVGLGVLNVLPIPVLDGGHLLLLAIESIRGKALTIRQMEIVQQVGLSLILLLMVVVIRNDLARLPIFN